MIKLAFLLLAALSREAPTCMAFSTGVHILSSTVDARSTTALSMGHTSNDEHGDASRRLLLQAAMMVAAGSFLPPTAATAAPDVKVGGKVQYGDEDLMRPKAHGTSESPAQSDLLYGVSNKLADNICNFNRHFAEMGGYFEQTNFEDKVLQAKGPLTFYDSVTGKPLFVAPVNRSPAEFLKESEVHGWPSFRDDEVVWENVRVLRNSGETVSVDGTHLGHNLPDRKGNRYCINLVSIAGLPKTA